MQLYEIYVKFRGQAIGYVKAYSKVFFIFNYLHFNDRSLKNKIP